jgi:hypothetical protein
MMVMNAPKHKQTEDSNESIDDGCPFQSHPITQVRMQLLQWNKSNDILVNAQKSQKKKKKKKTKKKKGGFKNIFYLSINLFLVGDKL